jgi:hypothetical protein
MADVIRDSHFEEYGEAKLDSKNRITLRQKGSMKVSSFKVYRNSSGQFVLDPQVMIPAAEAWLFKNEKAKKAVQKGLEEAKNQKLIKADEDYSQYADAE